MASPVYGTQAANLVNMMAGQARGRADAERMRRMQEQQDYMNAFNYERFMDQKTAREQARSDRQTWNAYNRDDRRRREEMQYGLNVYDRMAQEQARQESMGLQRERLNLSIYDQLAQEQYRNQTLGLKQAELMRRTGKQPKLEDIEEQELIRQRLVESAQAGDPTAAAVLDRAGVGGWTEPGPEVSWWDRIKTSAGMNYEKALNNPGYTAAGILSAPFVPHMLAAGATYPWQESVERQYYERNPESSRQRFEAAVRNKQRAQRPAY